MHHAMRKWTVTRVLEQLWSKDLLVQATCSKICKTKQPPPRAATCTATPPSTMASGDGTHKRRHRAARLPACL
uniref:Uncharacterized protein n=1 Tax=Arundo donax TaxID=35708 RepID=A0A0A9GRC5_ARUDO